MTKESKPDPQKPVGPADDLAKKAAELQEKLRKLLDEVGELISQSKKLRDDMHRRSRPANGGPANGE